MKILCSLVFVALVGCASNPFQSAKTTEQKAFATYGTFVVMEELGASLMNNPQVSTSVKRAIQRVDAKASPASAQGLKIVFEYVNIKNDLNASPDKKAAAAANLTKWYNDSKPLVDCLSKIISGGDASCSN